MTKITYTTKTGIEKSKIVSNPNRLKEVIRIQRSGGKILSKEEVEGYVVWFQFENYSQKYEYPTLNEAIDKSQGRCKAVKTNF